MGLFVFDTEKKLSPEERYGKNMLMLIQEGSKRDKGYNRFHKLFDEGFAEAGIVLGQHYVELSMLASARKYFEKAAKAGIAEGHWGAYGCISVRSFNRGCINKGIYFDNSSFSENELLVKKEHLITAARDGCADACNEIGNLCNRGNLLVESMYWYSMANYLGHQHGSISMNGISQKWKTTGSVGNTSEGFSELSEDQYVTAQVLLQILTSDYDVGELNRLFELAIAGEVLAGLALGSLMKKMNKPDMAYAVYNAIAFTEHPEALKCYADTLLQGIGVKQDITAAFKYFEKAANKGNAASMYVMGEKAKGESKRYLAAYWYGMAYTRGFKYAGPKLEDLL